MSTTLVRRSHRPPPLLTKELRKRGKMNAWALYKAYTPVVNLAAFALVLVVSTVGAIGADGGVWWGIAIVAATCAITWNILWLIQADTHSSNVVSLNTRRRYVRLDELRKTRAHRGDEAARLPELYNAYPRYSILVKREQRAVVLIAVKHERRRRGLLLRWKATETQSMYDVERGSWGSDKTAEWKIAQPTMDKVMERLTDAQVVVEELENNAYADALKLHQLDVLALAVQPPPASAFSRARVAVGEDVLDELGSDNGRGTEGEDA